MSEIDALKARHRADLEALRDACASLILHNSESDPPDNRVWSDERPYVCEENAYRAIRAFDLDAFQKQREGK